MSSSAALVESPEEIPDQLSGYWTAPWAEIPKTAPDYRPTGAVLLRLHEQPTNEFTCLDLIPKDLIWYPLSEAGVFTYAHSSGLLNDERWRFVCFRDDTATAYEASRAPLIEPSQVRSRYGEEAARRCRPDRLAVQLLLRRIRD